MLYSWPSHPARSHDVPTEHSLASSPPLNFLARKSQTLTRARLQSPTRVHTTAATPPTSSMLHLFASALLLASTAQAALYAGSSAERYTAFNSTLKVAFTVENGEGVMTVSVTYRIAGLEGCADLLDLQDGLRLLQGANGTNSTGNSTLYVRLGRVWCFGRRKKAGSCADHRSHTSQGVLLQFNETIGTNANGSSSGIPFVALVNCDYSPSAAVLNSTANSTTNSTSPSNSTSSSNSTTNGTSTAEVDVFRLAASLDAIAILLYSSQNEVSLSALSNVGPPLTASQTVLHSQLDLQRDKLYSYLFDSLAV